ncbi:hypothetical protein KL930_002428 [Ogataea haglerorum]|uniref:Uncharacterized protein n=1 Tax=Ogataea haglerorum TaxID=1937702 RepID=A0AAN6I1M5_9ASCO|nr:uncharacterized protein KL911_002269 [Ogataea haglerorum]KAG7697121.1 hypothetical protein KL915_002384 [Ogataea haglerorum]KAG7697190.1 hypothetical protein KL951_002552 [Ogataea haglerorum]KAG7707791.1 hypothetical protein KL914_002612 [Ogataea haglerorum]KAG7709828.1 hypothetical protein KL950_002047 [Ogataea haglerorum]KAG7719907.1 hypothetical protein KL913_001876 [Ogataea haglerorum]
MGFLFWNKPKNEVIADESTENKQEEANELSLQDCSAAVSTKSSKSSRTLGRRGTLRRFFSMKRKPLEVEPADTMETVVSSVMDSPELFNASYLSFDETRATNFSGIQSSPELDNADEYPHLRRTDSRKKHSRMSSYLKNKEPVNRMDSSNTMEKEPLPIQQLFEQEFEDIDNQENTLLVNRDNSSEKSQRNGLRRSLSKLFGKKDKVKTEGNKSIQNISDKNKPDPVPNFSFRSLRLNDTLRSINKRPESPNLANVAVFPAVSKIICAFGVESETSTQFEVFELQRTNKMHLNSVWNVWGEFVSTSNEDAKLRNRVIDKVWKTKQLNKLASRCSELFLNAPQCGTSDENRIHIFKFGLSPRYRKEPLLYNSGRVVIRIPSEKVDKVWRSTLEIVLKEQLLWSKLDNNVVGITWKRAPSRHEYSLILWLTKEGHDHDSVSALMNEVMLLSPDELKPLFTYSKYYVNADHTYHAIDLNEKN